MNSDMPKVLHALAGRSMLAHVMDTAGRAGLATCAVVVGADAPDVSAEACAVLPRAAIAVQNEQKGTGHAVLSARSHFAGESGAVVVLYGDTPLIGEETLRGLARGIDNGADIVVLGFQALNPAGYGRLLLDEAGMLAAIREDADASDEERRVSLCNSGVMAFRGDLLAPLLERIGSDNAKGEFYLTDTVELARRDGCRVTVHECSEIEAMGVDSRAHLAIAESALQERLRRRAMDAGVTMIDPASVTLSHDTRFGRDVVIEPNVFFGPGVTLGARVLIKAFSHIEGATIQDDAMVGPFARLRPGTVVADSARIGNFVELKQAAIGSGAKVSHLSYIGDAGVGSAANIGAGTITCNYDGIAKHRTEIGPGAFIGSNSSLVAPVRVGRNAYVGSGSVITKNVPDEALALTRAPQKERAGWAARMAARKKTRT